MIDNKKKQQASIKYTIVTAGPTYLDIDAYACMVAMAELINLKGGRAVAFSRAPRNYSVADYLVSEEEILASLPEDFNEEEASYIIVDVSDKDFLKDSVPLERVTEIYDHHVGFEEYWKSSLGENAHIEFIGAAATLIFREWKKYGLTDKMSSSTARLLIAAILDNTLNLTSSNTTDEDRAAFSELCAAAGAGGDFCGKYFSEVQKGVETDLKNALFGDVKSICDNSVLPSCMGQIAVWNVGSILERSEEIRLWFNSRYGSWMLNIIDIQYKCNYFVCNSPEHQRKIEQIFGVRFEGDVARTSVSYLRKEIIKKCILGLTFN